MEKRYCGLITPPKIELKELKNVFIQLCSKACNLKCRHCYIERNPYKTEEDFISIEKVKQTLNYLKGKEINSIYLTGGEPLIHPDFNQILKMCLKIANTTVMTNGVMINDKKIRFLKKIDDESQFETIYRVSIDSIDEIENDNLRGRGSFRKALCAIMGLVKYEFNPIISVVNYKNRDEKEIFDEFQRFFSKKGFELEEINLKIIPYFSKTQEILQNENINIENLNNLDCLSSRVISQDGVYSCPMLSGDYRAKLGTSIEDFSRINYLDCESCRVCINSNKKIQVNDWM